MKDYIYSYLKYIFILCGLTAIYLFNNHAVTLVFLILAVLIPVLSVCLFFACSGKLGAEISFHTYFSNRGDIVKLTVRVKNPSFYPQTDVRVRFRLHHLLDDGKYEHEIVSLVLPKSRAEQTLSLRLQFCGVYQAELTEYESFELFHLCGRKIPIEGTAEVIVMPSLIELNDAVNDVTRQVIEEEDTSNELGKGDNRSEIFDIRDYQPGDELTTIHWKLSAKTEALMVKEFSEEFGEQFTIFLELDYENNQQMDAYFDMLYTVVGFFLSRKLRFSVSYPDSRDDFVKKSIESEDDLIQLLLRLFYEKNASNLKDGADEKPSVYIPHSGYLMSCRMHSKFERAELLLNNKNQARLYRVNR